MKAQCIEFYCCIKGTIYSKSSRDARGTQESSGSKAKYLEEAETAYFIVIPN